MKSCRLPLQFDPQNLQADLRRILDEEWIYHPHKDRYEGLWSVVPLRSVDGLANRIFATNYVEKERFKDTSILKRCPNLQEVLAQFKCDTRVVRLMRLHKQSNVKEHQDPGLDYPSGEVRLHVPITKNPQVAFYLENDLVVMNEGECWYLNFSLPHRVENNSDSDRIHLVLDCFVNDWLDKIFRDLGFSK